MTPWSLAGGCQRWYQCTRLYSVIPQRTTIWTLNLSMREYRILTYLIILADIGISCKENSSVPVRATQSTEIWGAPEATPVLLTADRSHAAAHDTDDHGWRSSHRDVSETDTEPGTGSFYSVGHDQDYQLQHLSSGEMEAESVNLVLQMLETLFTLMNHPICSDRLNCNKRTSNLVELHHLSADKCNCMWSEICSEYKNNEWDTVWARVPYMHVCFVS